MKYFKNKNQINYILVAYLLHIIITCVHRSENMFLFCMVSQPIRFSVTK